MFLHFPATEGLEKNDPMHVENRHGSWKALEELVEAGSLKFIGISNFLPHHIEALLKVAKIKPVRVNIAKPLDSVSYYRKKRDIGKLVMLPFIQGVQK